MQYGMAIDLKKCMGCQTCATSCKLANNLPSGVWWNTVYTDGGDTIDTARGEYPSNLTLQHYPVACQQCGFPLCIASCSTGATWKDDDTGIILTDPDACIGCKLCVEACPYDVRVFYDSEPTYALDFAVGFQDAPKHVVNTTDKCTFCHNLVTQGEDPMCVQACVGKARFFGDLDDPDSEVSQLITERETMQLLPEQNTRPSVYYLI